MFPDRAAYRFRTLVTRRPVVEFRVPRTTIQCQQVSLESRGSRLIREELETDTLRKGVFMNEFLLLAVIMIYVAILY